MFRTARSRVLKTKEQQSSLHESAHDISLTITNQEKFHIPFTQDDCRVNRPDVAIASSQGGINTIQ